MITQKKLNVLVGILLMAVGILSIFLGIFSYDFFREFLCVIIGIGMIVTNIPPVMFSLYNLGYDKKRNLMFLSGIIGIGLGAFYIPFHGTIMSIVCGSFLIVLPTIRIVFEDDHFEQFKKEILLYVIGTFLLLNMLDVMFKVIVIVAGVLFTLVGGHYLVVSNINRRSKKRGSINAEIEVHDVEPLQIESKDE